MADDTARTAPSHGFGDDGADLLALASQRLEDFGGALTELANRYWILGAGGKAREIIEALSGIFTLSETLRDARSLQFESLRSLPTFRQGGLKPSSISVSEKINPARFLFPPWWMSQ